MEQNEETYKYWEPCVGCPDGHWSFWKTIVESPQWAAWEKVANQEGYDHDECRECGWFSPGHFRAFLAFCATYTAPTKD